MLRSSTCRQLLLSQLRALSASLEQQCTGYTQVLLRGSSREMVVDMACLDTTGTVVAHLPAVCCSASIIQCFSSFSRHEHEQSPMLFHCSSFCKSKSVNMACRSQGPSRTTTGTVRQHPLLRHAHMLVCWHVSCRTVKVTSRSFWQRLLTGREWPQRQHHSCSSEIAR